MSLRNRVADVIDQAPIGRRLWFAPPMKLSLAAVGAGRSAGPRCHLRWITDGWADAIADSPAVGERIGEPR